MRWNGIEAVVLTAYLIKYNTHYKPILAFQPTIEIRSTILPSLRPTTPFSTTTRTTTFPITTTTLQARRRSSKSKTTPSTIIPPSATKYELTPLPPSLHPTTIIIKNLDDFTTDADLSHAFYGIGDTTFSVPAVVARKPSGGSLGYGFVSFPGEDEARKAVEEMNGCVMTVGAKPLLVEMVRGGDGDEPMVRVPVALVRYTLGEEKPVRGGRTKRNQRGTSGERKERGTNKKQHTNPSSDNEELLRAAKRGFVTLTSTAFRRGRSSSTIATLHRSSCDERTVPQIVHCKASGGRCLDHLIIDLSPLREKVLDGECLEGRMGDMVRVAEESGMVLVREYVEDNTVTIGGEGGGGGGIDGMGEGWTTLPIGEIPAIGVGVFEGERSSAKEMAKELSRLWGTVDVDVDAGSRRERSERKKGKGDGTRKSGGMNSKTKDRTKRERRSYKDDLIDIM